MRARLAVLTLLFASAACSSPPGFAVEVTIRTDAALDETMVRAIRALDIHVGGSESFDTHYPVATPLVGQVGHWLYVPSSGATEAAFTILARDETGALLASGDSGLVVLRAGKRSTAEIVLGPPPPGVELGGDPDLAIPIDLGDLGDPGDLSPTRQLAFGPLAVTSIGATPIPASWVDVGRVGPDAYPDLVACSAPATVGPSLLSNDGTGAFPTATPLPGSSSPSAIALGRLDADNASDLLVLDQPGAQLQVYLYDVAGSVFGPVTPYAVGRNPAAIVVVDLDGDGDLDVAVTNRGSDSVSVFLNDGTGHFPPALAYPAGLAPRGLAAGQLVGDGKPELVMANSANNQVFVLVNQGDGTFMPGTPLSTAGSPVAVAIGDLDGDGKNDVAAACNTLPGALSVMRNLGTGTFAAHVDHVVGNNAVDVAIGDLDHDGTQDLLAVGSGAPQMTIFLGKDGFLTPRNFDVGAFPTHVVLADLDGDDLLDIALTGYSGVGVLLNKSAP